MKLVIELEFPTTELAAAVHVLSLLKQLEASPGVKMTVGAEPRTSTAPSSGCPVSAGTGVHESDGDDGRRGCSGDGDDNNENGGTREEGGTSAGAATAATATTTTAVTEEQARAALQERFVADLRAVRGMKSDEELAGAVFAGVAADVRQVLETPACGRVAAPDVFFDVLCQALFSTSRVQVGLPVVGYVSLLARLQEPVVGRVRERLVKTVLKQLTAKRPVDCDRLDFFAYAETFAALVKVEFVRIDAAISTITTLLQKPETRCAAVTMLGKTIELCLHLILDKCDPGHLEELRAALSLVTEKVFQYDVSYITENMSWTQLAPHAVVPVVPLPSDDSGNVVVPPVATTSVDSTDTEPSATVANSIINSTDRLPSRGCFEGHTGKIYAIAYDDEAESLVSGARDGTVISWDGTSGRAAGGFTLPGVYACSMAYSACSRSLYVCGVPRDDTGHPTFLRYTRTNDSESDGNRGWRATGVLGPDESGLARMVLCVRSLATRGGGSAGGSDLFATGESVVPDVGTVRVYDGAAGALETARPVASYSEHRGFVTALCANRTRPDLLVSGGQDGVVRVWDPRTPASVMRIIADADASQSAPTQDPLVTGVDARDDVLVAGLFSGAVRVWDVRRAAAPVRTHTPDGTPVLKVALCPDAASTDPVVAASTSAAAGGLHLLAPLRRAAAPAPRLGVAAASAVPAPGGFCDLAWGHAGPRGVPVLYAAGSALALYTPDLAPAT